MKRELLSLVLMGALMTTFSFAQPGSGGSQERREAQNGSGQQTGGGDRDRLRDGSCNTCPGCPSASIFVASPDQDRTQDRTQDKDSHTQSPIRDRDKDQDRDRIHR
jgi:hypothetical protein